MNKLALILCWMTIPALGQTSITIGGTVVDLTGSPVAEWIVNAADLSLPDGASGSTRTGNDGSFHLTLPRGVYLLTTMRSPPWTPSLTRVDARHGNVTGISIRLSAQSLPVPDDPPRAALIEVSSPDAAGKVNIIGAPGSVAPGGFLVIVTLDTGDAVTAQAREDGGFEVKTFARRGSSILIKTDPYGLVFRSIANNRFDGPGLSLLAGTIVRAPDAPPNSSGVPFARSGLVRLSLGPFPHSIWTFEGLTSSTVVQPGGSMTIEGTLRVVSSALQGADRILVAVNIALNKVAGPDGRGSLGQNTFASTVMTPTGLPIERERNGATPYRQQTELVKSAPDRAEAVIRVDVAVPPDLPHGFYVPAATFFFDGVPAEAPPEDLRVGVERSGRRAMNEAYLPVVRVGDPQAPRIPTMLLAEFIANGTRGVRAVEDRHHFGLSARLRSDEALIVPRLDAAGEPLSFRLEPFLPTIALVVAGQANVPLIPFRFPSGELRVTVLAPDGSVTHIGPAPFVQSRSQFTGSWQTAIRNFFGPFSGVFTLPTECPQLTTLDSRFDVEFARDGKHVVTMDGFIEDVWGNRWFLGGTYELLVARPLSVGTGVIPGTPFQVGDVFTPNLVLDPAIAAEVVVRLRLAPDSDPSRMIEHEVRGHSNRFGVFTSSGGIALTQAGEYRVDVTVTGVDHQGMMFAGSRTWGGVVAPLDTPIIAHGRRGMVNTQVLGTAWFLRTQTPFPTLPHTSHPNPPFFSGDVFWAQKSDTAFVTFTFQDPARLVTDLLKTRQRDSTVSLRDPGLFADRDPLGELPLFSSRADHVDPHIDPSRVDLWGYSYRYVERPMIAVREFVAEDGIQLGYWPFNDPYGGQIGMGGNGDLPNDFKFFFGGTVLRGSAIARPLYGIYGSLFVLVSDSDPRGGSRVMPPFQGNGGGPDGGPLLELKGREIDLFFHPTAVRPGTILHRGSSASFAGYSAPTLPSKIEIVVTSPSGRVRTISGQANEIGYFYDPSQDFTVGESGVWKARVRIVFDGRTSAGQVTEPFPTGDVLGSRAGEFYFYVVDADSEQLAISCAACGAAGFSPPALATTEPGGPKPAAPQIAARFVRPADGPITFILEKPAGLTNAQLTYTTTMPGFVLEEGTKSSLSYTYDAQKLAKDFLNLDLDYGDGSTGADTITISFLLSGTEGGKSKHYARQIVIQGEELQMPDQEPRPKRRAVR